MSTSSDVAVAKKAPKAPRLPQQSKNLRGRPTDPLSTRVSKTLAFLLRHGAQKESLAIRDDGNLLVDELVRFIDSRVRRGLCPHPSPCHSPSIL
jgi:2'-phosphotransferase